MLTALIGPIASLAGTWLDGKVEQTKATATAKVAKAKAEAIGSNIFSKSIEN